MQTSSVEIERVCDRADEHVLETAAISVKSGTGGPEQLVILAVLKEGSKCKPDVLKTKFSRAIHSNLNPLFKVTKATTFFLDYRFPQFQCSFSSESFKFRRHVHCSDISWNPLSLKTCIGGRQNGNQAIDEVDWIICPILLKWMMGCIYIFCNNKKIH